MLSNAVYFPKTFFTSPILRWILPTAFSAVPRSRKSESPAASPVFSFTFPFASSIRPLILSLVLDFTREESALMRILDVDLGLERLFIFLFYFFPRWVDPGSARLKKGKKVPGAGFLPIAPLEISWVLKKSRQPVKTIRRNRESVIRLPQTQLAFHPLPGRNAFRHRDVR